MHIRFAKMQGLGNDFVVIDAISQSVRLTPERVRQLADRRFGIGCDQILMVGLPSRPHIDFSYRIYNHDGSEVENCGNGARCFAKFVRDQKLTAKSLIAVETAGGDLFLRIEKDGTVTVDMGMPVLEPSQIPFLSQQQSVLYDLPVMEQTLRIAAVSMGNPHAVLQVDDAASAPIDEWGPLIESHKLFPKRVNVGFMAVRSGRAIDLRVYERGVGETLACGTGACAAVVAGRLQNLLDDEVTVHLPGGALMVTWKGVETHVMMTGPARNVYYGQITLGNTK